MAADLHRKAQTEVLLDVKIGHPACVAKTLPCDATSILAGLMCKVAVRDFRCFSMYFASASKALADVMVW